MALSISNLANGRPGAVSSFSTSSITPANGDILLIAIGSRVDGGHGGNTPTVSGLSLTWTQVNTVGDAAGTQGLRMTIYRALVSGSPSGTISVSFGGQSQTDSQYSIEQIAGANTGGTNGANAIVQSVTGNANGASLSISLSALKNVKNIAYGAFVDGATGSTSTVGSGFTALSNQNAMLTEYKVNTTTVNFSYTGTNDSSGIALELQIASGGFFAVL